MYIFLKMKKVIISFILLLVPFVLSAQSFESELFSEAESRYYGKNYAIALEMYDEFLRKYPLSDLVPDVQYRRAVCFYRLERYKEARSLFEVIERRYRSTRYFEYVPFWKGIVFYELGDHRSAVDYLDAFLKNATDKDLIPQALLYKILSELSLSEDIQAQKSMRRLEEHKGPAALTPYETVLYSHIFLKNSEYDELLRLHERIEGDRFSQEWREKLLLYRGEALWEKVETDRAEEIYRQLLDAEFDIASTAYRRLYIIAQNNQDFTQMERLIQRAEDKFAGSPELLKDLWLRIGIESFKRNELSLAVYFFGKVWNLKEEGEIQETVPVYLAEVYTRTGNFDEAQSVLEEYRALSGVESPHVMMRLGNLHLLQGEYSKAVDIFSHIVQSEGESKRAHVARYLMAYAQYRRGDLEVALENCVALSGDASASALRRGVLRLQALILKKLGRMGEASKVLKEYTFSHPDDVRAALDLVKLLFLAGDHKDVVSHTREFLIVHPDVGETDPKSFLLFYYFMGLSEISLKSYQDAIDSFNYITQEKARRASLVEIMPFVEYYMGWARYRLNKFRDAAQGFSDFTKTYPAHQLFPQGLYMTAWCYYSLGEYDRARDLFSRLAGRRDEGLYAKAMFLEGKSLLNLKKLDKAAEVFITLYSEVPGSAYADDALFEYAGALGEKGRIDEAAEWYFRLKTEYPKSPLAEEALYKRGELYFNRRAFDKSGTAFNDYRKSYPRGELVDAALYWEGLSASETGDKKRASKLWDTIVDTYEKSPFRPDALLKSAEAHVSLGEYQKSISSIEALIRDYPEYARAVNAELMAEEVRYLSLGMSGREAELTAKISREGGAGTREGRKSMLELSRLYLLEGEENLERAYQMLSKVADHKDAVTGAEAQLLLGEYYSKKGDYEKAGAEFFKASVRITEDRELMSYSIYRAAEMMKMAGKMREVKALVKRLEENFGDTEWVKEGKKLLEE
jgi:TolA-binding protein